MQVYGDSQTAGTANYVLETNLTPPNRCISKSVAIGSGAAIGAMDEWEKIQRQYGNAYPFPYNRLMPIVSIANPISYEGFAELYDDIVLQSVYDRSTPKRDAYMAGYSYEVTDIVFNNSEEQALYENDSIVITDATDESFGDCTRYTKGWAQIDIRKVSKFPSTEEEYGSVWADGYHHIQMIACSDIENGQYYINTGYDRSVTISLRATKLSSSDLPAGVKSVPVNKTHTEFQIVFYHNGQLDGTPMIWQQYPNDTDILTLNHTASQNSTLDLAVTIDDASTNGTYWDNTGWIHNASQSSTLANAISITKTANGTSLNIDWNIIRQFAEDTQEAVSMPIWIYGCWDQMRNGGTQDGHLIGDYNATTTLSADGMASQVLNVKSAGNLNKTEDSQSIVKYYTPLYKIMWNNDPNDPYYNNIRVMPFEKFDAICISKIYDNIKNGVYGLIYPVSGFQRSSNNPDTSRNYIGDSTVVSGGQASVTVVSTINEFFNTPYTVQQYFPQSSQTTSETYTINGQSLSPTGSITITPTTRTSTLNINFGNIPAGSARWLSIRQTDSREFANLSFTFNEQ